MRLHFGLPEPPKFQHQDYVLSLSTTSSVQPEEEKPNRNELQEEWLASNALAHSPTEYLGWSVSRRAHQHNKPTTTLKEIETTTTFTSPQTLSCCINVCCCDLQTNIVSPNPKEKGATRCFLSNRGLPDSLWWYYTWSVSPHIFHRPFSNRGLWESIHFRSYWNIPTQPRYKEANTVPLPIGCKTRSIKLVWDPWGLFPNAGMPCSFWLYPNKKDTPEDDNGYGGR